MAFGGVYVPGVGGPELEAVRGIAQSAMDDAANAKTTANQAKQAAENAAAAAADAQQTAESAAAGVAVAEQKADDAATAAALAQQAAADAQSAATTASQSAEQAVTAAQNAQAAADAALEKITEISSSINAVPTQSGALVYNGSSQSPAWNSFDPAVLTIGGTTSATDAGSYEATFTPKEGYQWADGTKTAKTVTWTITKASLTVPSQSGGLTYTGSAQSPSWNDFDANKMTIGGNTSGTTASTYTATFTPKPNYQWPDGGTAAKSVNWSIGKAAGTLNLNKSSASVNEGGTTTIAVTRSGDGAVSATSDNTGVATVSVSGTTVTVTAKKAGEATITVKVAAGTNYTAPANKTCSVTVTAAVYGVSWDGTSTTKWTRTDAAASFADPVPYIAGKTAAQCSSPFDTIQPWAGMVKSERTGGTMVAIPKFYYKLTKNGNGLKIQITNGPMSGFSVSPAHMNRGDGKGERDVVYVGRYHCAASNYKSKTGEKPKLSVTRANFRTAIHNLGTNIWQMDFATRFTLWLLYLVEFADWNSQKTIGKGCGDNSAAQNMGYTDSMPYHTGTTQSSRDNYGLGTQYRNIEGLWDNCYDLTDGCYNDSNGLNIILNPNSYSDSSGGTSVGTPVGGWPSAYNVVSNAGFPMIIPSAANGGENVAACDYWNFVAGSPVVFVGGGYGQNGDHGLFCVYCTSVTSANSVLGSRLHELP